MRRLACLLAVLVLASCQGAPAVAPPASLPRIPEPATPEPGEIELLLVDTPDLFGMLDVEHEGSYRWELVTDSPIAEDQPTTATLSMVFHATQQPSELMAAVTDETGTRRLSLTPTQGWTESDADRTSMSSDEVDELKGFFNPDPVYQVVREGGAEFRFEEEELIGGVSTRRYSATLQALTPALSEVDTSLWLFFMGGPITTPSQADDPDLIELWVNADGRIVGLAAQTHRGDTTITGEWHIWPADGPPGPAESGVEPP